MQESNLQASANAFAIGRRFAPRNKGRGLTRESIIAEQTGQTERSVRKDMEGKIHVVEARGGRYYLNFKSVAAALHRNRYVDMFRLLHVIWNKIILMCCACINCRPMN